MADLNRHLFPIPQKVTLLDFRFNLDESCRILVPESPLEADLALARFLAAELSDRYGLGMPIDRVSNIPLTGNVILIGSIVNPLIQAWHKKQAIDLSAEDPGPEGYVLHVQDRIIVVAGSDEQGAFYGLQTLHQLIAREGAVLSVPGVSIRDWPHKTFRGLRIYLPGREHIGFFKRFVRHFAALFKFNTLILEVNACIRLDRHPELNAGSIAFAQDVDYRRCNEPVSPNGEYQNSSHHDAADGGILEKEEVADLVRYATAHHLQVIPEIPSLTHVYYLLARHRDLAEIQHARWPDTYCPLNPASYDLLFDVMDEYIEVMRPSMVHIGHDEWRMPVDVCERCRGKDYGELFIQDLSKIYHYLHQRGIGVAMWGDHLMESVRNKGLRDRVTANGQPYRVPGALSERQVREQVPKDMLIFNWFWADSEGWLVPHGYKGEDNDLKLAEWGFKQVYGNFGLDIQDWARRSARSSVLGGAPSAWAATTELNFGKDLLVDFLGCANLLWSRHQLAEERFLAAVRGMMPSLRRTLCTRAEPSQDGDPVVPVDITPYLNAPAGGEVMGQDLLSGLAVGKVQVDGKPFELIDPGLTNGRKAIVVGSAGEGGQSLAGEVCGIEIGQDASSLIFLHACARPGQNLMAFHQIYNPADTAELLGWYEIVYEDGFIETIPIRYGLNILDWRGQVLYGADAVDCAAPDGGEPRRFFGFEWRNPRFGRVIREVNLKGTAGFRKCQMWYGVSEELTPSNAVILLALSAVVRRKV
ncbi:MAG: beta-N-acetylhexosaminidase [Anaerolineae bacterium]|nr:beta-N-acetylhexosaminidase [Anaerolineae bacterium]